MDNFLKTKGINIVDRNNKRVKLRGVNFGGWLMMEAYFMHSPNTPVHLFKKAFEKKLGNRALKSFEKEFRNNFIKEKDFKDVARYGFNCLRIPFNYRLVEKAPFKFDKNGIKYLDNAIAWARKSNLRVILDMHAAPGAQNFDWHSDSAGEAKLWKSKHCQARTFALWEYLADRYKDEPTVAGYDVLNEAVLKNTKMLNQFYKKLIKVIRKVDQNHIIFIEGNNWAQDIACLDRFNDENYALSIHNYEPLDFTFNFVPQLRYPLSSKKNAWNKSVTRKILARHHKISKRHNVPVFVGEFGVNYRGGIYNEHRWLKDTLDCFNSFGFHWTYWTYKAIKNYTFPDGVFSYYENPPWVNREGPVTGWHTYKDLWPTRNKDMIQSWRTNNFKKNTHILKTLTDAIK